MGNETQSQEGSMYEPLPLDDSFRLIRLHAGLPDTIISCSLEVVRPDSAPEYEAISYVWGEIHRLELITCNGKSKTVAPNLGILLRHLRSTNEERLVWIDALSINQADLTERSRQVQLMKQIFGRAQRVVAWLGQDHHFAESSIEAINVCATEFCKELKVELETVDFGKLSQMVRRLDPDPTELSKALLPEAMRILSLPWFTRVWIAQEAAHDSIQPYIGRQQVSWNAIRAAAAWLDHKHTGYLEFEEGESLYSALSLFKLSASTLRASQSLITLILHSRLCSATDARDKIFALVGLLTETDNSSPNLLLQPDYTKDVVDVYADMVHCLLEDQSWIHISALGIMKNIGWIVTDINGRFPSWIPRLDQSRRTFSLHQIIGRKSPGNWRASRDTLTLFKSTADRRRLVVEGLHIGTLTHTDKSLHSTWEQGISNSTISDHLRIVEEKWQHGSAWKGLEIQRLWRWTRQHFHPLNEDELANMFARTITASARKNKDQPDRNTEYHLFDASDLHVYLATEKTEDLDQLPRNYRLSKGDDKWDFEAAARDAAFEALFFTTDKDQMGLGTRVAQPGDHVCVLYGGDTPYLLRPIDGYYKFLGPCYVDGWMYGEAIRRQEAGEIEKQWFDMR